MGRSYEGEKRMQDWGKVRGMMAELVRGFGNAFRPSKVRRIKSLGHAKEFRRLLNQEAYRIINEYIAKQNEQKKSRDE